MRWPESNRRVVAEPGRPGSAARKEIAMEYTTRFPAPARRPAVELQERPRPQAPIQWQSYSPDFAGLLNRFEPITLAEMADVALQDRTDTKYLLHERELYSALSGLSDAYRVLDIEGLRLNRYRTLYFDTADFALFQRHHVGARERFKVRTRNYVDSQLSFLEVKHKISQNRTVKNRIQTPAFLTWLPPETGEFLNDYLPLTPDALEPKVWNEYTRITLVSTRRLERLTLDLDLRFTYGGRTVALPGLAIAEVKRDGLGHSGHDSDFMRQMRVLRLRPTGFSKYCAGVAMLHEDVKHNNFKPKLRQVSKLIEEEYHV